MTTAAAKRVDLSDEQLEQLDWLFSSLDKHEKDHLALELFDIIRQDVVDLQRLRRLLANWSMTAMVRHHPHFNEQVKEYQRLVEADSLF